MFVKWDVYIGSVANNYIHERPLQVRGQAQPWMADYMGIAQEHME